jgi:hypothetical protein
LPIKKFLPFVLVTLHFPQKNWPITTQNTTKTKERHFGHYESIQEYKGRHKASLMLALDGGNSCFTQDINDRTHRKLK